MQNKEEYLNKEITLAIKGIALILMFTHHFFTFPNWIISGNSYPYMVRFCYNLKICVPIYAFITGYIYAKNEDKRNIKYSIKKITDILLYYWSVYIVFLIINFMIGNKFSFIDIIKEIFLIYMPIMCFGWYIRFYCITMLILPILNKFKTKTVTLNLMFLFFQILIINIIHIVFKHNIQLKIVFDDILYYLPCVYIGVIFGRYSIFNKIHKKFNNNISIVNVIASLYLVIMIFLVRSILPVINFKIFHYNFKINLDIIYIPVFLYCLIYLIKLIKYKSIIVLLGKYSLLMWLTHCIFFNTSSYIFQPILYIFKNPVFVLLWGLFLCFIMAVIFEIMIRKLIKLKNKLQVFNC